MVQLSPLLALLVGFIPSVIWLAFWLQVDRKQHEPRRLLIACFVLGAFSVLIAKYVEQSAALVIINTQFRLLVWAAIEEVLKFMVFFFVAYNSPYDDEAIEPAMYMIVTALGFAALENLMYVVQPSVVHTTAAILLTGGLRFFGSTLLHSVSSCFVGIVIGITAKRLQPLAIVVGLAGATLLHATFNFFIMKSTSASLLEIYACLFAAALVSHMVLERIRRTSLERIIRRIAEIL